MPNWLQQIDIGLFRWINQSWSNPFFDKLFEFLSGNAVFYPLLACTAIFLWIKGGRRGRIFVCITFLSFLLSELIVGALQDWIARPRPFMVLEDAICRIGKGGSGSMPSSHTSTWFVGVAVTWIYWKSCRWWMPILASGVALSRIYNGVHYPSDIIVGAMIGIICGLTIAYGGEFVWSNLLSKYFPSLTSKIPSLLRPEEEPVSSASLPKQKADIDRQFLIGGYLLIVFMLIFRWWYLWQGKIELSEDEAYQWVWSKYLALSYFSKPLMIALSHWTGTHLWGDNMFGVRFLTPVFSSITSLLLLRFLSREANPKIAFFTVLAGMLAPLLAVGSLLMTVDPLAVMFWTAALVCGWKAVKEDSFSSWIWMGIWMGFGFLSKYSTPVLLFSWIFFFILCKPARIQLRKPGIYLSFGISLIFSIPVLIWNYQNEWISFIHVVDHGQLDKTWHFTLRYFGDFTGSEFGLLNPIFFIMILWASFAFWKKRNMLTLYLFSFGGPIFAAYWLYTLHSRVYPNWIAPAVISLFALAGIFWGEKQKTKPVLVRRLYISGVIIGLLMIIPLHDTNLITKVSGWSLPAKIDPLRRVRAWSELGETVEKVRKEMEAKTKEPFFIIGDHYGITGQLSFEIPEARQSLNPPIKPLVYYMHSTYPENQFYFWPSYREARIGENAIFVKETDQPQNNPPERILNDFERVENLGFYEITYRGRVFRTVQLFACYKAKPVS